MFGISFEELVILAVLAFILFGPQKLPEYAAKAGHLVAKLRQATTELSQQVQGQNPFQFPPEPGSPPAGGSTCPNCHHQIGLGFTFCPQCGQRVQDEPVSPYPEPPQAPAAGMPAGASGAAPTTAGLTSLDRPIPPGEELSIRPLGEEEGAAALETINAAAQAYQGVIPADCWQDPYMAAAELRAAIRTGVKFWAAAENSRLLGVMGRQDMGRVSLIRHAYVRPEAQRQGVGALLLAQALQEIKGPVLVGTWAAAWWAIRFYEKHGFKLVTQKEKDRLLQTFWSISPRQMETSVVLANQEWFSQQSAPENQPATLAG